MRLIDFFEVAPDDDEAFIAEWERARELLAAQDGLGAIVLYRALRSDVEFRFADIAEVDGAAPAFASHPNGYEIVVEAGTPDREGGVVLINPFEVPAGEDERFIASWERARELLAAHRGYLGTRLHRSVGEADFRFVDVTRWSSPLMLSRATQSPELQEAHAAIAYGAHPALYSVVGG
jgi:heme oxygenase (mycobilin-producing)